MFQGTRALKLNSDYSLCSQGSRLIFSILIFLCASRLIYSENIMLIRARDSHVSREPISVPGDAQSAMKGTDGQALFNALIAGI